MVKESNLMFENKKPFEEVQEVSANYENPSFEEFMKNYEYDTNLNYDDLNGGDISEVRGYGPCSSCGRSDHIFKLEFAMFNGDLGKSSVFYSTEQALNGATEILLGQNHWENDGLFSSFSVRFSSGLRQKSASAIQDAVRIYRLGGSINGWLEVKESWTQLTTKSNYACGVKRNGESL